MRRRFPAADDRPDELRQEVQLIFNSRLVAFREIGIAHFLGSKKFLAEAAEQEKKAIDAGRQPPRNLVAERAYFVDCLNDESAAIAKRWENLVQTSDSRLGERRAHFKDRRKPRLLKFDVVADG